MNPLNSDRGASAPPCGPGARGPRARPVASLEAIGHRILAALATGPKTRGELLNYHLPSYVKAADRDRAVEELLGAGRIRLTSIPHPLRGTLRPMPALALPARKGAGHAR